jgi:hypothetical protein
MVINSEGLGVWGHFFESLQHAEPEPIVQRDVSEKAHRQSHRIAAITMRAINNHNNFGGSK